MKTAHIPVLCLAAAIGLVAQITVAETYTTASYVQNGLVGQWDGIDNVGTGTHDPNANYWVDLKGNSGDFAVFTGVASFTDNGLRKNAQGTGYRVHAIRFYDRQLTPAEIAKNARRDAIPLFR